MFFFVSEIQGRRSDLYACFRRWCERGIRSMLRNDGTRCDWSTKPNPYHVMHRDDCDFRFVLASCIINTRISVDPMSLRNILMVIMLGYSPYALVYHSALFMLD